MDAKTDMRKYTTCSVSYVHTLMCVLITVSYESDQSNNKFHGSEGICYVLGVDSRESRCMKIHRR